VPRRTCSGVHAGTPAAGERAAAQDDPEAVHIGLLASEGLRCSRTSGAIHSGCPHQPQHSTGVWDSKRKVGT